MLDSIRNLRQLAERLAAGELPDPRLCDWASQSLRAFVDHRVTSLEDAFGLRAGKGGMPWWKDEAVRLRNAAIRALAERLAPEASAACQAKAVRRALGIYCAGRWRFDRERAIMPPQYAGTSDEWLWRICRSGAPASLGERQLRSILAR